MKLPGSHSKEEWRQGLNPGRSAFYKLGSSHDTTVPLPEEWPLEAQGTPPGPGSALALAGCLSCPSCWTSLSSHGNICREKRKTRWSLKTLTILGVSTTQLPHSVPSLILEIPSREISIHPLIFWCYKTQGKYLTAEKEFWAFRIKSWSSRREQTFVWPTKVQIQTWI